MFISHQRALFADIEVPCMGVYEAQPEVQNFNRNPEVPACIQPTNFDIIEYWIVYSSCCCKWIQWLLLQSSL